VRDRFPVSPERFRQIAFAALAALTLIVMTGAAVRLTDSGLGCPDWPRCYGKVVPPLSLHSVIEFGNRFLSGLVGFVTIGAFLAALLRTPRRRDLVWISALLPVGVLCQAVLGGFTVTHDLAPGFVMAHFGLSMVILVAAVTLAWRAAQIESHPPSRPRAHDRATVWVVRLAALLGAAVLFVGTVATAAGPHAGGSEGQLIHRLHFRGASTLTWAIHRHAVIATLLGLTVILAWLLARRRAGDARLVEALVVAGVLMASQGLVGSVQFELHLPADMVWVHVALATLTWIALLWAVACAGRLTPRRAPVPAPRGAPAGERPLAPLSGR
jgi:cytochrome c oxidase assembly protein subunit 15